MRQDRAICGKNEKKGNDIELILGSLKVVSQIVVPADVNGEMFPIPDKGIFHPNWIRYDDGCAMFLCGRPGWQQDNLYHIPRGSSHYRWKHGESLSPVFYNSVGMLVQDPERPEGIIAVGKSRIINKFDIPVKIEIPTAYNYRNPLKSDWLRTIGSWCTFFIGQPEAGEKSVEDRRTGRRFRGIEAYVSIPNSATNVKFPCCSRHEPGEAVFGYK